MFLTRPSVRIFVIHLLPDCSQLIMLQLQREHGVTCHEFTPFWKKTLRTTFVCLIVSFILLQCEEAAAKDDFYITCPKEGFEDQKTAYVTCTVDGNAITNASCDSISLVVFQLLGTSTPEQIASSDYPNCNPDWKVDARCVSKDATTNVFTYQMKFLADNATQYGKSLKCWSNCRYSAGPFVPVPLTADYSSCHPIIFKGPLVCDGLSTAEIVGLVISCFGVVLLVAGIFMKCYALHNDCEDITSVTKEIIGFVFSSIGIILLIAGIIVIIVVDNGMRVEDALPNQQRVVIGLVCSGGIFLVAGILFIIIPGMLHRAENMEWKSVPVMCTGCLLLTAGAIVMTVFLCTERKRL